jgi:hypothetical protein
MLREKLKKMECAKEEDSDDDFDEEKDVEKEVALLTDNYRLSYKDIKNCESQQKPPLLGIS